MQNPVTKLGVVRRLTYFPDRRLLRVVLEDGRTYEAKPVEATSVSAAQPFENPGNVERLVDRTLRWRLVGGAPPRPPPKIPPKRPSAPILLRGRAKRMAGRFVSPLGLVQSVTYDRAAERLRLTLSEGGRYESSQVRRDVARSLFPVRNRAQFDRLLDAAGQWMPLDADPRSQRRA